MELARSELARALFALLLATRVAFSGYKKRSLSFDGACLAFFVGLISCAASVKLGLTLIAFFLGSSKVTRVGAERKKKLEDGHQVGGNRNWVQVAANGGLATAIAACFWLVTRRAGDHPELRLDFDAFASASRLQAAYLCHYACCNADTWASELGVLSRASPILVTRPWRRVPPGTNGGVTWMGTAASALGGLLIGAVFWAVGAALQPPAPAGAPAQWPIVLVGAAAGVLGSLIDSLLGATFQYSAFCEAKQLVVEAPSPTAKHISGWDLLDNHQVNFLAAAATSAIGATACSAVF